MSAPDAAHRRTDAARLRVDRIACTGHGVCAAALPGQVSLDEHGYPVVTDDGLPRRQARRIVDLCPRRALYLSE